MAAIAPKFKIQRDNRYTTQPLFGKGGDLITLHCRATLGFCVIVKAPWWLEVVNNKFVIVGVCN